AGPVKHTLGNSDALRVLHVDPGPFSQIDQPRFKSSCLFRQGGRPRRQLQVLKSNLVNGGGTLIQQLGNRFRGSDGVISRRGAKTRGIGVHPDVRNFFLLANKDRLNRSSQDDCDVGSLLWQAAARIEDRTKKQELGARETVADLDAPSRYV